MGLQHTVVYKKGIHNGIADSLYRKPMENEQAFSVSEVKPVWLELVINSYHDDAHAQQILQQLAMHSQSDDSYTLSAGIIRYQNKILVGSDQHL